MFANVAVLSCLSMSAACTPVGSSAPPDGAVSGLPPTTDPAQSVPAASGSVPCGHAIDAPLQVDPDDVVVLDNVALPLGRALQVSPAGSDSERPLFAKHGLVIRVGVAVELLVPREWETRVQMGWGSPATPGRVAKVPPCPASGQAPWLVFAGGYWVDAPVCFPLIVRTQGRETQVRMGVGQSCSP